MTRRAGSWRTAAMATLVTATSLSAQTATAGPVEVPLSVHGGRMVVPVEAADGTTLDFLVSMGVPSTVLSQSVEARLGSGAELTLGGLPVPMEGAMTLPDAQLRVAGRDFAGMVAPNMLNAFNVLLDAPGGRMVLAPTGRSVSWEGVALSEPVRLRVYHGIVLGLDVQVNGKEYPAMLELGTPGLLLNQGAMDDAGVAGGRVGTLRLGTRTFADVPATVTDHPAVQRFSPDGDPFVLVGTAVSVTCAVSVSWIHRELRTCVR